MVAGTSLIAARSPLAPMRLDGAHNRLGTVAPANPWKWSGTVNVGYGGRM